MTTHNIKIGDTLTCHITGKQFTAQVVNGFTTNYATDGKNNVYSDEGVTIATRRDISNGISTTLYATHKTHGSAITGWKGDKYGEIIGVTEWERYSRYGAYKMYALRVRMFDGSIWQGRVSEQSGAITLRKKGI